nr:hypothetical protein GCM10020093_039420 [Planobispora longispora]
MVTVQVNTDVADLFEVKAGRIRHVSEAAATPEPAGLHIFAADRSRGARVRVESPEAGLTTAPGLLTFRAVVPARGSGGPRSW